MEKIIKTKDYSYSSYVQKITALKEHYPFLKLSSIGQSCLGKKLISIQIGTGQDNILFTSAFHGSERITALVMLKFIEEISEHIHSNKEYCGVNLRELFTNKTLIVIPLVNPDGCEIARGGVCCAAQNAELIKKITNGNTIRFNANARGVDLNHNFPAGWEELKKAEEQSGIFMPAPTRYGGRKPLSEPETVALSKLCKEIPFSRAFAFHSQGEVIYHRYKKHIPLAEKQAKILSELSGYALEEPTGLAVGGGFKDYFIETYSRPAFTVEMGKGENPLCITDSEKILNKLRKMLITSIIM